MGLDRETSSCKVNLIYSLFCKIIMLNTVITGQLIKEINRDYHGDIFILSNDFISCDPSICAEGQRFAAPVSGHPCKCQCDPSKQVFREDMRQCVRDLDDCPLVTFTRTYISETIPVVSLPTAGQLVHPGAHLNLENRHNVVNQTCRVESDLVMTSDGWIQIDGRPVFALIMEGSRSFLQWVGNDHNRRQLEQKLVLIRFNCQLKPRHGSLEVAPYRPCAAVRIGWVPGSSLSLLNSQGGGYHDSATGSGNQGKSSSGYLIIGLSIGVLGLTYVLSLMIYLRSKRIDTDKHYHSQQSQRSPYRSSQVKQNSKGHGSSSSYYGDSSSNQTGSSSLERGNDQQLDPVSADGTIDKKADSFTLSMGEDYGQTDEFNPSIITMKSSKSDGHKQSSYRDSSTSSRPLSQDAAPFNQRRLSSSFPSSVPVSNSASSAASLLLSPSINTTALLTFPSSPSSVSSISSTSSSSCASSPPPPPSPPSKCPSPNNQHTKSSQSSLTSLQTQINEKAAQLNVQTTSDSTLPYRRPTRLSRRDLAIAPKLLDPEALSSPSPTAIEFLSRLREVISSARGRMKAFRFKPTLLVIPEDDYFIPESESRYRSITSSTNSIGPSSLESDGEVSKISSIKSLILEETLSMHHYDHEKQANYQHYNHQQQHQPLSLPAELSKCSLQKSKSWKSTINQFLSTPKLHSVENSEQGCSLSSSINDELSKSVADDRGMRCSESEMSESVDQSDDNQQSQHHCNSSANYRPTEGSLATTWGDDKASRVSRREIVDRLAEEMVIYTGEVTSDDAANSNTNNHYQNESDSLNDLSDINENMFETNSNPANMFDNITSENLANLSNEVEKKLAQRSIVPLPEVVTNAAESNKMKVADGVKSNAHNHTKEDSKLSQLVADLKHFTRKRKQIKTSKSLPLVSDNNWMLQPVASMSLRLSQSRSTRPSISEGQSENRSMRSNPNLNNSRNKYNSQTKLSNKQSRRDETSQVIIQEGRYLNLNNHSPISDDDRSIGNEVMSSRCGLETWSLTSELSTGSLSPIYMQSNANLHEFQNNVNMESSSSVNDNHGNQSILDSVNNDHNEVFIKFAGNQFDSTLDQNNVAYISRFNLIKKYIDDPNSFNVQNETASISRNNETKREDEYARENDEVPSTQMNLSDYHLSNVIISQSLDQTRSMEYKAKQPSTQPLSISSTPATIYPEMCSSDDGLSSASVSSIMFIESPNQGTRMSADRRLASKSITKRDNQMHIDHNTNRNTNNLMRRETSTKGNYYNMNVANQPTNGIRLTRQTPVQKRHFPNGLMTIA